jgi:hypothetical protein
MENFAKLLEHDQIENLQKKSLDCDMNIKNCKVTIKEKKKYTCVDVGGSGRYMIDNATREIFGVKSYGVINRKHRFGTLDTIYNYYWGDYTARAVPERNITEYKTVANVLGEKGVYIDEEGRLYGGEYGEKAASSKVESEKIFGANKYRELADDLTEAGVQGVMAAQAVPDSGTCNLDSVFLRLKGFNEEKTLEAIHKADLNGFKTSGLYFGKGYLISVCVGQAYKNEIAAKTMYEFLKGKNYDVSRWMQMD